MKKTIVSILLLASTMTGFANEDKVLMTINGEPIMLSEFEYIYEKNNTETALEQKTKADSLDLFVNFKLKVAEAKALGIDTTQAFKEELAGYRAKATPKYLQDQVAIDSLVELSYHRMANIRKASHIAIMCPMDADSATQAAAEQKIQELRQRVTVGLPKEVKKGRKKITVQEVEDFGTVAAAKSDDKSAVDNKGALGWIQPFRYVY